MIFQAKGNLWAMDRPQIMGILNVTDDSFYAGSRLSADQWVERASSMLQAGAQILDIGGQSTRPGSKRISADEELERVMPCINAIADALPEARLSIDTYYGIVAKTAVAAGISLINDISAGQLDPEMWPAVAQCKVPYVLMHMQGEPGHMQLAPHYEHITQEVFRFLSEKLIALREMGVKDIIVDPGFGFGKSMEHNYQLMRELEVFHALDCPIMVGVSRKKMIQNLTGTDASQALNGTTAMHMIALTKGAQMLRVHDVKEAAEAIKVHHAVLVDTTLRATH
jgi:dihydropteroate synthase